MMESEGKQEVAGDPPPPLAGKHGRNGSLSSLQPIAGNVDSLEFNRASVEPRPTPMKIPGYELLGKIKPPSHSPVAPPQVKEAPAPPLPQESVVQSEPDVPQPKAAPLPEEPPAGAVVVPSERDAGQAVHPKVEETPAPLSQEPVVQSVPDAAQAAQPKEAPLVGEPAAAAVGVPSEPGVVQGLQHELEGAPASFSQGPVVQSELDGAEGVQPKEASVAIPAAEKLESHTADAPPPILDGASNVATGSSEGKFEEIAEKSPGHGIEVTADNKAFETGEKDVLASSSGTTEPAFKPGRLTPTPTKKWRAPSDAELKAMVVIPEYLSRNMEAAVKTKGEADPEGLPAAAAIVEPPRCPILVFINSKSGGRLGPELTHLFEDLISSYQVYDLASHSPSAVLQYGLGCLHRMAKSRQDECAKKTLERLRILVAGGDGTVGWVLSSVGALRELPEPVSVPPVGVIPLGTGNDLSRSFGWGGEFSSTSKSSLKKVLWKALNSTTAPLDAWKSIVMPAKSVVAGDIKFPHAMHPQHHVPLPSMVAGEEHVKDERDPSFEGLFFNYFSVGMDAQVAYGFHHLRDEKPWLARGRTANQVIYSSFGCTQGWFCTSCSVAPRARGVSNILKLWVRKRDSKDWVDIHLPSNIRAVIICNLKSYAGGRNPWGKPSSGRRGKEGFEEQRCNDGLLEVMGLKDGWHSAFVLLEVSTAVRLCQAEAIKLELNGNSRKHAYLQMDGEPWMQPMGTPDDKTNTIVMIKKLPDASLLLKR